MADCSASGTAIDRVIQLAVASSARGNNGAAAAASATASAATRAFADFLGGTTMAADSVVGGMLGGGGGGLIMPMAPLRTLGGSSNDAMMVSQYMDVNDAARLDDTWAAAASSRSSAPASRVTRQHHHQHPNQMMQHQAPMQGQIMSMQNAAPQHGMVMMHYHHQQQLQHQQMMMMQQMQMQQHQMAAMVQYQKQQQRQQQVMEQNSASAMKVAMHAEVASQYDERVMQQEDDDVATVSEDDAIHHEGITEDASIERLAQAWRDAEAEYAQEFDNDHDYVDDIGYDASDLGGLYSAADTATSTAGEAMVEPHYQFSEASQNYGCIRTTTTDVPPQGLAYPQNLYEQGLRHFDEGNISEAILCFESTLRNIDPEHADAWRMLGKCHTENDEDQKAIVCWLRSLERDPFSPETLLALGVSYVNELDHEKAIESLRGWVANHPLYAGMIDDNIDANGVEEDLYGSASSPEDETVDAQQQLGGQRRMRAQTAVEMRDVERLLLRALDYDRTADAAADVYEALGVVYNVSRDYDAAADAFRRAIDVRPMDYQLRNKLGATLANGNRSDEALPSYREALSLKPKYARGWLNMAISHSNLHNYTEASRCYLQTLSLNPDAKHVWSYLRIALTCDEKWDLLPFAASQNLSAFRDHFDFVDY
ncbi:hypothetical protein ACHAW5_010479 [Stephanodiscus triporus]|uniref:Peroxin-5 n=1 Tax=Stephanodiscus triporus TaxID=2934178 RepID=A0ABD3NE96_9STRA